MDLIYPPPPHPRIGPVQVLETLCQGECLRHPRVQQSQGKVSPALVKPRRKRHKKEIHKKEPCEYYEQLIERYVQAGWEVIGHRRNIRQWDRWVATECSLVTTEMQQSPY